MPLETFLPAVASWFRASLGEPTRAQELAWPPIARGESTLLLAPTGSGKTLAAFLVAIDRLARSPAAGGTRVVYVSPLKALAVDVEKNLRAPLAGITEAAARAGAPVREIAVAIRTGDTPAAARARMARRPGDILITTPESLFLMLTSAARATLAEVEVLIVDEIHALVPTKRGAHLALSIERLEAMRPPGSPPLQRIGLSATQRPLGEVACLLGGFEHGAPRPVTVVDAGARKALELSVENAPVAPPPDADDARSPTSWPGLAARVAALALEHRSTIVFVNSRRLAERLATAVDDAAGQELALAHHGSLALERRTMVEDRLKRELRALVATSSLELGIDMGAVDLVVQVEAPPSVASGQQRVGRACHAVGGVPRGVLLARHRHDLLACAAAAAGMRAGDVEETFYPRSPLDVLAQQIVAMVAVESLGVGELFERVRRAAPFAELPRRAFDSVLDMLSGRYPSTDFSELRARLTWDREAGTLHARPGSQRLAVTNAGTIPDRGLYGVFTAVAEGEKARRVGELDEEMVFELRPGEVFLLGASSWRAERITPDRVVVSPAAGEPGKMPFWHGDRPGRARRFGLRIGELTRRLGDGTLDAKGLREESALDAPAAAALVAYVKEQALATGELPSDRAVVVERFVDEVGDWRVVLLCPLGTRVLAPWAIALGARLRETYVDVDLHTTDDGIALRIPACDEPPPGDLFFPTSSEIEGLVTRALDGSAIFAARFRESATRALLLPRRDPRGRTPLWAQRRRAGDLLGVASAHPEFPIVLETYRECLRDAFDLSGLVELLRDVETRRVRVTVVDSRTPSPFAASVLFSYVASFLYDGDASPAERRAQALTVDPARLRELLGDAELRDLLDPDVLADHVRGLQRLSRPATTVDDVADLLRSLGHLSRPEIAARSAPAGAAEGWVEALVGAKRALEVTVAGERTLVAVEDAARYRDALGVALPARVPAVFREAVAAPLDDLLGRYARTHGPFTVTESAARFGLPVAEVEEGFARRIRTGKVAVGAWLPGGTGRDLCDADVLDALRRRSLARVRRAVEPVEPRALARLLTDWQGLGRKRRGRDALLAVVGELEGCPLVASCLEREILPARIDGYRGWDLDALCASGEVVWAGLEPLGASDGRVALYLADHEAALARPVVPVPGALAATLRETLSRRGAVFFADLARAAGGFPSEALDALWAMVWAGEVTNDTLEPLRSRGVAKAGEATRRSRTRPGARPARAGPTGSEGRWSLRATRWSPVSETDRRTALARALLDRYGVVTKEAAHAEGIVGGFAAVYDVLKALEERGRVRRGYLVAGRGGAQFSLPGADERLRAGRDPDAAAEPLVLAATDPANAYGAILDWPASVDGPQRAAGALVVLRDGELLGWLARAGRALITFLPEGEPARGQGARALASALGRSTAPGKALLVSTLDGEAAAASPLAEHFVAAGFFATARGLMKRVDRTAPLASVELAR